MNRFAVRLEAKRLAAGLSIKDLSLWLCAPYATTHAWTTDSRQPHKHTMVRLEKRLGWLEDAITNRQLPMLYSAKARARKGALRNLLADYERADQR